MSVKRVKAFATVKLPPLPFLRTVKDIQYFNNITRDAVGNYVRRDDQFAGHGDTAGAAAFGELPEALAAVPDAAGFGAHGFGIGPLGEVGANPIKILERGRGPADVSRHQRSGPTWRRLP